MDEKETIYAFNIDRGGTFTDFYVQQITENRIVREEIFKVPSESAFGQGPILGIRNYLLDKKLMKEGDLIPTDLIKHINLGTTIATNALLQRRGCRNTILLTKGFGDLLKIRHQARPNIFDLKCQKPAPLCTNSVEVNERVYLNQNDTNQKFKREIQDVTFFVEQPQQEELNEIYLKLKRQDISSVGISLCNSYLYPTHQKIIRDYLIQRGIENVEIGSNYKDLGYLKRSETTSLDAFLNPIMSQYFKELRKNFQNPETLKLRIMKSEGGFDEPDKIKASQLLLSGPAGGLIGCQSIIKNLQQIADKDLIGLDMGGTSTDVSRLQDKQFSTRYDFQIQGIEICTPHLQIDTIAAGGGSKLTFQNQMFVVGPQSVGSNPGPVCYGIGDELSLTDANLILDRLDISYFPRIFGKNRNECLNAQAAKRAFQKIAQKINGNTVGKDIKSIEQIAEGYIQIANQLMAKSARKILTLGKPDAIIIFGSAGGQHCCDLALKIGVEHIFIHKYSGILSAFGLSKAPETKQNKHFIGLKIERETFKFEQISKILCKYYTKDISDYDKVIKEVGIGYKGTSYTIKVPLDEKMLDNFQVNHKKQNGFSLPTNQFRLEYFRQVLVKIADEPLHETQKFDEEDASKFLIQQKQVYFNGYFRKIPFYDIQNIKNCNLQGPAILLSRTSSIFVKDNWIVKIQNNVTYLSYNPNPKVQKVTNLIQNLSAPDPIKLTLYSTRLMAIAQQMGKVLQKISISTNIRQRLDFSCGIFDWNGKLLANAPHLPVHLGSMQTAVLEQIKRGIQENEVILTNHPIAGGSHLPDLTVVTCFKINESKRMYLASRGHHADIGGSAPGSMPAFSKSLSEEGVAVQKFKLIQQGQFQFQKLRQLFKQSRRIQDNVSDLLAQVAANHIGIQLLKKFVSEYGFKEFQQYVHFICENAKQSVQKLLDKFSNTNNLPDVGQVSACEFMDDGTPLKLKLTINRITRRAVFDFSGTGMEVLGNTNAPKSITRSAILYCLRSLIGQDIPLNSGCLDPLDIIIPQNSILSPSKQAAVVGGNVQTSQKLVDLILKPFNFVACSQGTMNNFLFGTDKLCYYETICGGSGAGDGFNGTTTQCHMTNTRITDVEYLEKVYPVIVKEFNERVGSGGRGKFRGGNGVVREFQFLVPVDISILSERRAFSPYGLNGGENGALGKNILKTKEGLQKSIGGKNTFRLNKFESVRIQTPGGGGYGSPQEEE